MAFHRLVSVGKMKWMKEWKKKKIKINEEYMGQKQKILGLETSLLSLYLSLKAVFKEDLLNSNVPLIWVVRWDLWNPLEHVWILRLSKSAFNHFKIVISSLECALNVAVKARILPLKRETHTTLKYNLPHLTTFYIYCFKAKDIHVSFSLFVVRFHIFLIFFMLYFFFFLIFRSNF